jgi:PKD repeat protein
MPRRISLGLSLIILILIYPGVCKEVAYAYGESGSYSLGSGNIIEYNGSDVISFTVAGSPEGGSATFKTKRNVSSIKYDINEKINKGNMPVTIEGRMLIGEDSSHRGIDQICSIYDAVVNNWTYVEDWKGLEQIQYSNLTLELGKPKKIGKGDCDDFAILLAALVESVGGTPRIIFAYGPMGGHAYAEVYLGKDLGQDSDVDRMLRWLRSEYKVSDVKYHKDLETDEVWLNLDWWKDPNTGFELAKHPGGPFFLATNQSIVYPDDLESKTTLTPHNEPPIAKFSVMPPNPNSKDNVTFDASQSKDMGGEIKAYRWEFGDNSKAESKVTNAANHTYLRGGTFKVNLTVKDNDGDTGNYSKVIEINELPIPVIDYGPNEPRNSDRVTVDASQSSDKDGSISRWLWEFGDDETSGKEHPSPHQYDKSGNYTINLTVFDDKGAKNSTSTKIKINEPPVAIINFDPKEPNVGDDVKFDASKSFDIDGSIREYYWDFGDGSTTRERSSVHAYEKGGEFSVKLVVRDENNATAENSSLIIINRPPIATFSYSPNEPVAEKAISFDATGSKDEDGKIKEYIWDFGEGRAPETWTKPIARYIYSETGKYKVNLTVIDDTGGKNAVSHDLIVASEIIVAPAPVNETISVAENNHQIKIIDSMNNSSSWKPFGEKLSPKLSLVNESKDTAIRIDYDLEEQGDFSGMYKDILPEELNGTTAIKLFYSTSEDLKAIEIKLEDTDKSDRFVKSFGEKSRINESGVLEMQYNATKCISSRGACFNNKFSTDRIKRINIVVAKKGGPVKGWLIIREIQGCNLTQM